MAQSRFLHFSCYFERVASCMLHVSLQLSLTGPLKINFFQQKSLAIVMTMSGVYPREKRN